jgi:hypothetical protein
LQVLPSPGLPGFETSFAVTVKLVMVEPPLFDGGVKLTDAEASPGVATAFVGAPGAVARTEKL